METTVKSKKRTRSGRMKHRAALELSKQKDAQDRLIDQAIRKQAQIYKAQLAFNEWVEEKIEKGIIQTANESLEPKDQLETITLFSQDGAKKFYFGRQSKKFVDARAQQAMALIESWLNEKEQLVEMDADSELIYEFLRGIFFGSRNKQFRWTPQLMQFITMETDRIHDSRLKQAQKLLKASLRVDKSEWMTRVFRFDEENNEYVAMKLDNYTEFL